MDNESMPAISVIIPMYNAEKYIGECLDSILAQTFTDYEVIVVDNCSTDNSAKIVESYVPKFGGKLQIIYSQVHSESSGTPRNTGIRTARGEYIMFVDSDDVIIETAFEELYPIAKNFEAEVVYCEKYYTSMAEKIIIDKNLLTKSFGWEWLGSKPNFTDKPILTTNDLSERISDFVNHKIWTSCWNQLFLRSFIIENNIFFPEMAVAQDVPFNLFVLCLAKKIVRVPNMIYVWRTRSDSTCRKSMTFEETVHIRITSIFKGINLTNSFSEGIEFFKQNTDYLYSVFDVIIQNILTNNDMIKFYTQNPAYKIGNAICRELEQIEDKTALTAFLFNRMNIFNVNLIFLKNSIAQKNMQLQQFQEKLMEQQAIINQKNLQLQQAKEYLVKQQELIRRQSQNRSEENNFSDTGKESNDYEKLMEENVLIKKNIPAISVIIPMYNAEKYISECLDSILAQTFTDFEVIVVDDCSKDNSAKVVESYIPKFNGKLQLVRLEVNSGGGGYVPRNIGLRFSRGEYIFFMDSDDAITANGLEDSYNIAKKFNADVVHCEKYYRAPGDTVTTNKNFLKENSAEMVEFVKDPTLVTNDLAERVKEFGEFKFIGFPWNNLILKDMLAINNIEFPQLKTGGDHLFFLQILCFAKKFVRISTPYYVYRQSKNSISSKAFSLSNEFIRRWTDSLFRGSKLIDDFMNKFEVLKNRPDLKYSIFNTVIFHHTKKILPAYSQVPAYQLDDLIRRELEQIEDKTALTAFLFNRMNIFNVNLLNQQQEMQKLQANLQKSVQYLKNQSEIIESQRAEIEKLKAQLQQK